MNSMNFSMVETPFLQNQFLNSVGQLVDKVHSVFSTMWYILSCLNISVAYLNHLLLVLYYWRTYVLLCLSITRNFTCCALKFTAAFTEKILFLKKGKQKSCLFECVLRTQTSPSAAQQNCCLYVLILPDPPERAGMYVPFLGHRLEILGF